MNKYFIVLFVIISLQITYAQNYSTAWFGPNANPVPEFTDARIPAKTTLSLMADYYFGYGDKTKNGYIKIEVPLLSERVSLKVWTSLFEHYEVTPEISAARNMINGNTSGNAVGEFYVQTRLRLIKEQNLLPSIILNSTLKSASSATDEFRRYFNAPGYYFDMEIGKSLYLKSKFINEIRTVANIGFFSWQTITNMQDDAPMYGAKIIIGNNKWKLENCYSKYNGWVHANPYFPSNYGDQPIVYATKLNYKIINIDWFAQYQYGIRDFPYHQLRAGMSIPLEILTPKYKD